MAPQTRAQRIALLIETDGPGGAERLVAQLANELDRRGHSVVVYLPSRGNGWLESQLSGSSIETDHFWLSSPFDPGCARQLARSLQDREIELAHSHEFSLAFYGAWAARIAHIPHLITMHGGEYYAGRIRRRLALRAAVQQSALTVAVSRTLAERLARDLWLPRGRVKFLPNGVRLAPAPASTLRQELGLPAAAPLLVCVGSLYPVKGHRYLLEAVKLLAGGHPDLHVAIAGRGEQEEELRASATALGIGTRVHLLGLRPDIPNLLAAADVFVQPSLNEGLPLAVLEAMLASRAIVASNVGEIGAVLDGGNAGLLVNPGNASELAAALGRLLDDRRYATALARRAFDRAQAEYSFERMVSRYDALYQNMLAKQGVRHAEPAPA